MTLCALQSQRIQMVHARFTTLITRSIQPSPRLQTRMVNCARPFVINWITLAGSRAAKFSDQMVVFGSRAAINTMTPAAFWKKRRARQTEPFSTRSLTVTTRQASKLVIPSSTHPEISEPHGWRCCPPIGLAETARQKQAVIGSAENTKNDRASSRAFQALENLWRKARSQGRCRRGRCVGWGCQRQFQIISVSVANRKSAVASIHACANCAVIVLCADCQFV